MIHIYKKGEGYVTEVHGKGSELLFETAIVLANITKGLSVDTRAQALAEVATIALEMTTIPKECIKEDVEVDISKLKEALERMSGNDSV